MSPDVLDAFARHCDRHLIDRRPTIWAHFTDIWGDPQGEIGIPNVTDANLTHSVFALLAPWALIPTMSSAWLVVDRLENLSVVNLKVNGRGIFNPSWTVDYSMDDYGHLEFGEPVDGHPLPAVGPALDGLKRVRNAQTLWKAEHTFNSVLPVVQELLGR